MKQRTIGLDTAENEVDCGDFVYTKGKPSLSGINQLKEQKRHLRASMKEESDIRQGVEYELCVLISERIPRNKKKERIQEIISKIKELQKEGGLTDFSKGFLNGLLKTYAKIGDRKRQKILKEVLKRAKKKERVVSKKYLSNVGVDRIWREQYEVKEFFSFV